MEASCDLDHVVPIRVLEEASAKIEKISLDLPDFSGRWQLTSVEGDEKKASFKGCVRRFR